MNVYITVPRFWFSSRFAMALLGFIGFLSMSSQRMCITVALFCMLNQTAMTDVTAVPLPPTPALVIAASPSLVNGSNVSVYGAMLPSAAKTCGEIPEIFVLNTSDFNRVNVNVAFCQCC